MLMQNVGFSCSQDKCDSAALCKGLCNAHYLRYIRGSEMKLPVKRRERNRTCKIDGCGKKHYGNDLCNSHWRSWSRHSIKVKLIEMLGGKCQTCEKVFHPAAFDFHHLDPKKKDFSITNAFNNKTFEAIEREVKKCILLCANCHRIEHAGEQYA